MNFSQALRVLKGGAKMTRPGWNGKGMYIYLIEPSAEDPIASMWRPFLAMKDAQGMLVPWLISMTDLFAEDWEEVNIPDKGIPPT